MDKSVAYEVSAVCKAFRGAPGAANTDISFEVGEGEFFGVLGSNGAGKTTLIKQMVGLLGSDSGSIRLFGRNVAREPIFTSLNVGYMPQSAFALNSLTVSEAIYYSAHLRGVRAKEARAERDAVIDRLAIGSLRKKIARHLSGGERRLLQLAVTLAGDPPVLILDEPTNELDPARRRLVWQLLRDLNREQGKTIVLITHNALEAEQVIERVAILREGRVVALGAPAALKKRLAKRMRLEITLNEERPPELPGYVDVDSVYRDRLTASVEQDDLGRLASDVDLTDFLEFRLQSPTLEDVYLDYAAH